MTRLLGMLAVLVFVAPCIATEEAAQQSDESEVLNRYLGTWTSDTVFKPSKLFPEGKSSTRSNEFQWILDGKLQQTVGYFDEDQYLRIQRYNEKRKMYEMWIIHASGDASYWVGSWNDESMNMTWKYVDFGSGITGTMVDHVTSEGKGLTSLVLKDVHENLLLDGQIESRRTKQPTE